MHTVSFIGIYEENKKLKKRLAECENRALYGVFVMDDNGLDKPVAYGSKEIAESIAVTWANSFQMTTHKDNVSTKIVFADYAELKKFNENNVFNIKIFVDEIELGTEEVADAN